MDVSAHVLGVYMGVRNFRIVEFWRRKIDQIDVLEIQNYWHEEAYQFAKDFFLKHREYSHLLIIPEDAIVTPDHVDLLLDESAKIGYPVISGYSNIDFRKDLVNITTKDLRNIKLAFQEQYQHPSIKTVLVGAFDYPLQKVFFCGHTLCLIRRDVVEKTSFKAYKTIDDLIRRKQFGTGGKPFGIMHDVQFCIECANLGVPIYVDLRLLFIHFGVTVDMVNLKGKIRTIRLYPSKEHSTLAPIFIAQEPPYF